MNFSPIRDNQKIFLWKLDLDVYWKNCTWASSNCWTGKYGWDTQRFWNAPDTGCCDDLRWIWPGKASDSAKLVTLPSQTALVVANNIQQLFPEFVQSTTPPSTSRRWQSRKECAIFLQSTVFTDLLCWWTLNWTHLLRIWTIHMFFRPLNLQLTTV